MLEETIVCRDEPILDLSKVSVPRTKCNVKNEVAEIEMVERKKSCNRGLQYPQRQFTNRVLTIMMSDTTNSSLSSAVFIPS